MNQVFMYALPVLLIFFLALKSWPRLLQGATQKYQAYQRDPHKQTLGTLFYRLPTSEKIVYLTYDDGPYEPYTSELLDVLDELEVKATFFVIGENAERFPEALQRIQASGHQLGNHTYSHPDLASLSLSQVREEIRRTDALLEQAGVAQPIAFRAPFLSKGIWLNWYLHTSKREHISFDFYPAPPDWRAPPQDALIQGILRQLRPGSVLVLHDGHPSAAPHIAEYSRELILRLRELGYQFRLVSQRT